MKKILLAAVLMGAATGFAQAADVPMMPPVVVAPDLFDWSGFYAGGFVGGAWATLPAVSGPATHQLDTYDPISATGWLIGGQVGGDWQNDRMVFGVVGEAAWLGVDGEIVTADEEWQASVDWYAALSGKLGVAFDRAQLYAKAGVAVVGASITGIDNAVATTAEDSNTHWGGLIGIGAEFAVTDKISIFAEGDYIGTASADYDLTGTGFHAVESVSPGVVVAKIGINVRM